MSKEPLPLSKRTLTPEQYRGLADVPPETEWLANLPIGKTRCAYKGDVAEIHRVHRAGIGRPAAIRDARSCHRMAQRHGVKSPVARERPAKALGPVQRLYPITIDTMHARVVTLDDELLLYVEVRRLMKVIEGDA